MLRLLVVHVFECTAKLDEILPYSALCDELSLLFEVANHFGVQIEGKQTYIP